jgi:hypothetical protein
VKIARTISLAFWGPNVVPFEFVAECLFMIDPPVAHLRLSKGERAIQLAFVGKQIARLACAYGQVMIQSDSVKPDGVSVAAVSTSIAMQKSTTCVWVDGLTQLPFCICISGSGKMD